MSRYSAPRKSAPSVKAGRVQKKNNWTADPGDYWVRPQDEIRIDRRDPGEGYRHLLTVAQLKQFISLLPMWDEVAVGLDALLLDTGDWNTMGWHDRGIVAICAWDHDLWWAEASSDFIQEHAHLFELLEVETRPAGEFIEICWTETQARAFQLLHILPHELGHHHDRMTTRSRRRSARGERYAEDYANRALETIWPIYGRQFEI